MTAAPKLSRLALTENVDSHKVELADYQNARTVVSAYVQAVNNVNISGVAFEDLPKELEKQLPKKPQDILAELNVELDEAKNHGVNWSNNISPDLTAIPQAIINYGTTFNITVKKITPILNDLIDNPNSPDFDKNKKKVIDSFEELLKTLVRQSSKIEEQQNKLKQFNTDIHMDANNFSINNTDFEVIRQFEEANIKILCEEITSLNDSIDTLNTEITATSITEGASVAVTGAGIGLIGSGGPVKPIIGAVLTVVGLIGIGLSTAFLISAIEQKTATQSKITKDNLQVTLLSQQCMALTAVQSALGDLVGKSQNALLAVQVILETWSTLEGKLKAVIDDLKNSEKHIGEFISIVDLEIAEEQWEQLISFANLMQSQDIDIDTANNRTNLEIKDVVMNP